MHKSIFNGLALAASIAVAGCSSPTASTALPQRSPNLALRSNVSNMASMSTQTYVFPTTIFEGNDYEGTISMFGSDGTPQGQISGLPGINGMAVDASANLWVSERDTYHILEYAYPYTSVTRTITDADGYPYGLAVSVAPGVRQGMLAVSSMPTAGGYSTISLYHSGASRPCRTFPGYSGMPAFDGSGNLYLARRNGVAMITGGCDATQVQMLTTSNDASVWDLAVDPKGRIALLTTAYRQGGWVTFIDTYNPPVAGNLDTPIAHAALNGVTVPSNFAISHDGHDVWITNNNFSSGTTLEYAFPQGGNPLASFNSSSGDAFTIAVTPPVVP
jgi:hypothetical protein